MDIKRVRESLSTAGAVKVRVARKMVSTESSTDGRLAAAAADRVPG